jgi:hypothetical protein
MTATVQQPWIQTLDGHAFNLLVPDPAHISVRTISVVLSRLCRFSGHCRQFYCVADHSVRVCQLVMDQHPNRPDLALAALLHDAHEAFSGFGDVCRPAKSLAPVISQIHARIDLAVAKRFGFDPLLFATGAVHYADNQMLATELRDLMRTPPAPWDELPPPHPERITPNTMHDAAARFEYLARYFIFTLQSREKQHDDETTTDQGH